MMRQIFILFVVLALGSPVMAQRDPRGDLATALPAIAKLMAGDKEGIREAIKEIDLLRESQAAIVAQQLRSTWLTAIIANGFYEDAERLALGAMEELAYDATALDQLQRHRIKALLAAGRTGEAVSASKGLFSIASMGGTRAALLQMAECLSAAHPEDTTIVNQFRREQMAGQKTAAPTTRPTGVLAAIAIDPTPFAGALTRYDTSRYTIESNRYRNRVARGNLLLLCDRPDEARTAFEEAMTLSDANTRLQAIENVARAIKAQTGAIGPANAWLREYFPARNN